MNKEWATGALSILRIAGVVADVNLVVLEQVVELARCLLPRGVLRDVVLVMQHGVDEDGLAEIDPDDHLVFFSYLGIVNLEASFVS